MCIDDVEAQRAVEKYCDMYPAFQDTRECKLLRVSLFITINCCEVNNINFKKDILLSYWRNRDDSDIDNDSKLGQHGHFNHWYHVMIVNVEPRLGENTIYSQLFYSELTTPNSLNKLQHTLIGSTCKLRNSHVYYIPFIPSLLHACTSIPYTTMMVGWRSVILVNMITELWMMMMIVTILIMGLMALIDFKLSATMATVLVTED